jgi:SPP1 gp7 family putative phage head morphogenesis protein
MKLTKKRNKWAEARSAVITGKPLNYPAAPASRYQSALNKIITKMTNEYEREIKRLYTHLGEITTDASIASQARILLNRLDKKWSDLFNKSANGIVERMLNQVSRDSKSSVGTSLKELAGGLTIKVPEMPAGLHDKMIAATVENVSLIKTIPAQYHRKIEGAVMRSIEAGGDNQALFDDIKHFGDVTPSRAKLIANDQVRKASSAFNNERMQAAGIKQWRWLHSGGSAVPRQMHLDLDGQIFNYDDEPPIIDPDGTRGYPGFLIHCKCVQVPVVSFEEVDD